MECRAYNSGRLKSSNIWFELCFVKQYYFSLQTTIVQHNAICQSFLPSRIRFFVLLALMLVTAESFLPLVFARPVPFSINVPLSVCTSHNFERLSRSTFFFGVLVLLYYIALCSLLYFYPKPKLNAFEFVLVQGQNEQMAATITILFCVKQRCETYLTHLKCGGVICFWLM